MSDAPSARPMVLRRALPGLLFVVLVVAVYSPTLFSRRNFVGRDLLGRKRQARQSYWKEKRQAGQMAEYLRQS